MASTIITYLLYIIYRFKYLQNALNALLIIVVLEYFEPGAAVEIYKNKSFSPG